MENLEFIMIHQEVLHREVRTHNLLRQSGIVKTPFFDSGLTLLGDSLIHLGTRLKQHTRTRVRIEGASAPTFLIML